MNNFGSSVSKFRNKLLFEDSFTLYDEQFTSATVSKAIKFNTKKSPTIRQEQLITPRLLLVAIDEIAKKPTVTEGAIIKRYKRELIKQGKELLEQYQAGSKSERGYAEALQEELSPSFVLKMDEVGSAYAGKLSTFLAKGEKPLKFHHVLWDIVSMAFFRICLLDKEKGAKRDIVSVVKKLFQDEIKACQDLRLKDTAG